MVGRNGEGGMRSRLGEALLDPQREILKDVLVDVELPFEVRKPFALHLVDFAQVKHALGNDTPGLV